MKIETHLHTKENDPVVDKETPLVVQDYYNAGFRAIVITNHYMKDVEKWFPEIKVTTVKEFTDYYLSGYKAAKAKGDELGMTILLGVELRFEDTSNDYLVYGLTEEFLYNSPLLYTLNLEDFRKIMPKNARIYQAHPFRKGLTVADIDLLDGIEVFNGGSTGEKRNKLAEAYAEIFGKNISSGSDYHHPNQIGLGGIVCDTDIKTQEDFVRLLDSQNFKLIKNGMADS